MASTVIAEIFVRVKISYSGVREFSYAINFRTLKPVSHTLAYVQGFRMLLIFVLSAKSTKYTKLNRVLNFLRLQPCLGRVKPAHRRYHVEALKTGCPAERGGH